MLDTDMALYAASAPIVASADWDEVNEFCRRVLMRYSLLKYCSLMLSRGM